MGRAEPSAHVPTYIKKVCEHFEWGYVLSRSADRCDDKYVCRGMKPTYEEAFTAAGMVAAAPHVEK